MRRIIRPFAHHLKWPIRLVAFTVHLMHHLAAFFAWAWMLVHMAGTLAQAGLQAGKLWETQVLSDIWRDGVSYFTTAGGLEWQKALALAVVPAFLVALRNAWATYEQFRAWVHDHHRPPDPPSVPS